jgi:hypothetical protein
MAVLGIRAILVRVRIRILGSVPLTNESGCGFGTLVHIHLSSKKKSQKEVSKQSNQGFFYYFCLMMEGSGWRIRTFD